mmetsp:Transcript_69383/g.157431  ORF Transcript_69383/g.157431 Transcript_69383/m.157431 type:complete len:255 (-) Transcript_69383:470-1234(-)
MASWENRLISPGRYWANPRAPLLLGTMETLSNGSACSRNQPAIACPDSCNATVRFSWRLMRLLCFGRPPMILSVARSKSSISTAGTFLLAAKMAASLQRFAMSLPAKPGVRPDILLATASGLSPSFRVTGLRCTLKMASRSPRSGLSMAICRSKRPGRVRAGSRMSARFVPASTTTPVPEEKPSISTSIWLRVFSRSSLPPPLKPPLPRFRPTASISSMKMIEGALARACWNRSRTRDGPTPTNISMKSEPLIE